MSVGRISTYALQQSTLKDSLKVENDLATEQGQLSSGDKSQDFAGLGGSASEQYLSLSTQISKTDAYTDNNLLISNRLSTTSTVLSQVIDTATNIKTLIAGHNIASDNSAFALTLTSDWQALTAQLNTSLQGRYLFSGSATNTPAVDTQNFPTLNSDGTLNQSYYQGDQQNLTARVDDNVNMTYNVRADNPGIQLIMQGLALAKQGDANNSSDNLSQAYTLVSQGLDQINAAQASVNQNTVSLNAVNTSHDSFKVYWQGVKDDIGNTDIVSVSTQVALNQGILQAAFQTFAKINSLRLSDYLK